MTRSAALALAALLLSRASPAAAQFRATPMRVPAAPGADLLTGRFSSATTPGELVTVDRATGAAQLRGHGALLAPVTYEGVLPAGTPVSAGRTRANAADLLSEVAYPEGASVVVRYGTSLGTPVSRPGGPTGPISFAHVLPHDGDLLAFANPGIGSGTGFVEIWDFETTALGGTALPRSWTVDGLGPLEATEHVVSGLRLSPAALALGVDDLALPTQGGVVVLAHRPATADLRYAAPPAAPWEVQLADVRVGGASPLERPAWLPATIARKGDALGAAALDLDLDGAPDLLFSYGSALDVPDGQGGLVANHLVAVLGAGDPQDLAGGAWRDVTGDGRLGLRDPVTLRQVEIAGAPAVAVWDRALDEVVVFRVEAGALRVWRGAAAGRRVHELRVADVAGSAAPDLVAAAEDVLVWPDLGDASPTLAWAPGSPGPAVRGRDLPLSVSAGDADGAILVEWRVGDPYGTPVRTEAVAGGPEATLPWAYPGALLCEAPPQTVEVTARATDAQGVFAEVAARLEVSWPAPALAHSAAPAGGRLVLPPGGTTAAVEGATDAGCGPPVFTWGGTLFDAATSWVEEATATTARRTVELPEAIYPALLAGPDPTVTLVASDGAAASAPAALALDLDASGLVEVVHSTDVSALAPGELALLRTVVRSRLGVPLPQARLVDALGGLLPAGPPRATGATVAATLRDGAEVVLDALPGGGAEVVIELPVRGTGGAGGSAVEVRSSGGHLLTPPAATPGEAPVPGCGCGGAAAGEGLLALALAWILRRRRRAT